MAIKTKTIKDEESKIDPILADFNQQQVNATSTRKQTLANIQQGINTARSEAQRIQTQAQALFQSNAGKPISTQMLGEKKQITQVSEPQIAEIQRPQSRADIILNEFSKELPSNRKRTATEREIEKLQGELGQESTLREELQQEETFKKTKKAVDDLGSQLDTIQASFDSVPLQVQNEFAGRGVTVGGLSSITRERQRDLSIRALGISALLKGAQGQFSSAKVDIDNALKAKFDPIRFEIDTKLENLQRIDNQLTKEEKKRAVVTEARLLDEQERVDIDEKIQEGMFNIMLEAQKNGASQEVVGSIKNARGIGEAIRLAGNSITDKSKELKNELLKEQIRNTKYKRISDIEDRKLDRLIKLGSTGDGKALTELGITKQNKVSVRSKEASRLNKEIASSGAFKAIIKAEDSWRALKNYEDFVKEKGSESVIFSPVDSSTSKNLWNTALLNMKEFYNLGVLNGPDLEIMENLLPSNIPEVINTALSFIGGGAISGPIIKKQALNAIEIQKVQFEDKLDNDFLSIKSQFSNFSPDQLTLLKDTDRKYLQMKQSINPKVAEFIKSNPDLSDAEIIQVINTRL